MIPFTLLQFNLNLILKIFFFIKILESNTNTYGVRYKGIFPRAISQVTISQAATSKGKVRPSETLLQTTMGGGAAARMG